MVSGASLPEQRLNQIVVGPNIRVGGDSLVPYVEQTLAVSPVDPRIMIGVSMRVDRDAIRSVAVVSRDGGQHWREVSVPGCGFDPWVTFAPSGEAFVTCLTQGQPDPILLAHSADGGLSWRPRVTIPLNGASFDHPTIVIDATSGARSSAVYLVAAQSVRSPSGRASLLHPVILHSTDGGRTFSAPVRRDDTNLWANVLSPVVLSDGSVGFGFVDYAVDARSAGQGVVELKTPRVWWVISDDGGQTLSAPSLVTEIEEMSRWGHVAVDASEGPFRDRLYVVTDDFRSGQGGVLVLHSLDRGETWSRASPVGRPDAAQRVRRYPTAAVNQSGTLLIAWFDPQEVQGRSCFQLVASASFDGGLSFLPPTPVAEVASCSDQQGNLVDRLSGSFDVAARWPAGGDYFGLAAHPDGSFRALWSDSRTGTFQLWTARIVVRAG
jgi:hypothetical protein